MQTQPPQTLAPPGTPAASAALEVEMDQSASREHVTRLAVHLARAFAGAAAIFTVGHDLIEGVVGEGFESNVTTALLPVGSGSLLGRVAASGEAYRGRPPEGGLDEKIFTALGRGHVSEIAILPVALQGRVVNLLYADNGPEILGDASIAALGTVCTRIARVYARLILERKARVACRRSPVPLGSLLRS